MNKTTKIISWNVNGLRALIKKENLNDFLQKHKPHIFCISETMDFICSMLVS